MRRVVILILVLLVAPAIPANARSVHSTSDVDIFPQGGMKNSSEWNFQRHLAFTPEDRTEDGEHTIGMLADSHITMGIELPEHLDEHTFWASSSSTDSNATLGMPDGAYTYSTGPDIRVGGFDVDSYIDNQIRDVHLLIHFEIPDRMTNDKARFSVINSGVYDLFKTWSNTQGGLYYMSNGWSTEITSDEEWTWSDLSNLEIDLDYVSNGESDDSQLRVDAVGLKVTMQTPWYGAERVVASSQNLVDEWPIIDFNLTEGVFSSVSIAPCGLQSTGGTWITEVIEKPADQSWGRLHFSHTNSSGSIELEYLNDNGAWIAIAEGLIPSVNDDLQLKFTISDTCLSRAWIDINDPHIRVKGSISGDADSMVVNSTRWTIVVNGETIANNDATSIGDFDIQASIGHTFNPSDNTLDVKIKAWYNWGNNGSAASMILQLNEVSVIGAYSVEYDEDPICSMVGSHNLQEDGGGILVPLISRCSDDRTPAEQLSVEFENDNPELIEVDLTQGQVRIKLVNDAYGIAQFKTIVTDQAGNYWIDVSTINIEEINDLPVLGEFQSIVPVELGYTHNVSFILTDIDTFNDYLTVTTNRSWATIDMTNRIIRVNATTPGFTSITVTACDEENCVERILDIEVRALAELYIEEVLTRSNIREGDVFDIEVYVRNSGQISSSNVGIRCYADERLIDSRTIDLLVPGQLGVTFCDMQAPYDDDSIIIKVEVDRSMNIDEINEENNLMIKVIPIFEEVNVNQASESSGGISIGQTTVYVFTGLILLVILGVFGLLAPAKIKKLE